MLVLIFAYYIMNIPILNVSVQWFTVYVISTNLKSSPLFDNIEFSSMSIYHQMYIKYYDRPIKKIFNTASVNIQQK